MKENTKTLIIIFSVIILMAYMDIIVLEKILHPTHDNYPVPWNSFYVDAENFPYLWWWMAFIPMGFITFALLGWAAKSWKLFMSGSILFLTGWEDIFYYILRGRWIPTELAWLNENPIMFLINFITPGPNVTNITLTITALTGITTIHYILNKKSVKLTKNTKTKKRTRSRRRGTRKKKLTILNV